MTISKDGTALAARLGVADDALLRQALTHRSAATASNERLEFLGDRVLNLAVAAWVYRAFPELDEGALSLRHTHLVRGETCAAVGEEWGLWPLLQRGAAGQAAASRQRLLADAVEALLAVVYMQHGMAAVQRLVETDWAPFLQEAALATGKDAKTALQEWLQAQQLPLPVYKDVGMAGPDHAALFTVRVQTAKGSAEGAGPSKAAAGMAAATKLLATLKAAE